jgi:hypothetical protein
MTHRKSRLNVFIEPAQRQQIDALCAETGKSLAEVIRELLAVALPTLQKSIFLDTLAAN